MLNVLLIRLTFPVEKVPMGKCTQSNAAWNKAPGGRGNTKGGWFGLTYKLKLTLTDKKALNKDTLKINDNWDISGTQQFFAECCPEHQVQKCK